MRLWRNSFVTRWAVLSAALIIAVVLVSGWLRDRASREYFLQDQRRHLANRVELMRARVQSAIDAVRKDILYLSRAPAFARLAAARDETERAAARREAASHVIAGLQVRPTYFQARLIGLADGGRELFRFDQVHGEIRETPPEALQREGGQNYFLETAKLPAGKFYLSEISLNQESGKVSEPRTPTLRAATPIFDEAGKLFGIVIVNVDVTTLFDELRNLAGLDVAATLSNSQGDYLLHPDPAKCFGFDLGRRHTLFEDHPQLRQGSRRGRFEEESRELSITDEFPFTWDSDQSLILRLAAAKGPLLAPLQARRAQNLALTVVLAAIAGAVMIGVTRLFARGLRHVAEAVEHYEPGESLPELPDSPDEVGLLARKFRDMAAKISEQMQSLREARQRAEAAMRAREEFMATMSHEIRTPMNAVLGMAHLLESEANRPQQAERLRTLKFAGRHLMALLNNLLDRDRIESGDIVFDRVDFDLRELLDNLRLSLEPLASRKELAFVLETGPALPSRVHGDAVRLYQVLNNLAHNAIKFTTRGRIVVRVECAQGDEVRFEISDTGPGLPAPVLASLRHPDQWKVGGPADDPSPALKGTLSPSDGERDGVRGRTSIPQPTSIQAWGSGGLSLRASSAPQATAGLGLRISQRLIELLGGQLAVASTPAGTTISFSLRLPAASAPTTCPAPEAPPDLSGYSALVVEDVPSNQLVLGALLEKTGMAIDFAATAARAREMLPLNSYDLAFVDIQLPDADGAELAAVLLRLQPELRVIAVTAQVSPEVRAACEAAGVRAFVTKPIEPAELYEKLRRLTAPQVELIERTFDHDQGKVSEYLSQLDRECQAWEVELRTLLAAPDVERLRRLHHRLKNAAGQLGLWKLDRTLGALREAMERGEHEKAQDLGTSALRLIAAVRQFTGANRLNTSFR